MLPVSFDDNATYVFLADSRQGFYLVLTRKEMIGKTITDPHWVFESGDQRSMNAASHWLSARRGKWEEWGELVEKEGRGALEKHLAELMAKQPIGEVQATVILGNPGSRAISLGEMLITNAGPREEVLYEHRFSTSGKSKRFFEWLYSRAGNEGAAQLTDLAMAKGTAAVAVKLEEIATGADVDLDWRSAA
jgi:hypothetical protein